jgi:hypothetical protein
MLSVSVRSERSGRERSDFAALRRKKPNVNKSGRNALQKKAPLLALLLPRSLFQRSPRHLLRVRAERIVWARQISEGPRRRLKLKQRPNRRPRKGL